jgi:hypothetical protein
MHQSEQRGSTGQHALPARQPCSGLSTHGARQIEQATLEGLGPPTPRRRQFWSLLSEDAARTAPLRTEEAADMEVQGHAAMGPGQVSQRALIAAVDPMRSTRAERAARGATRAAELHNHALLGDPDAFKAEAPKLRE